MKQSVEASEFTDNDLLADITQMSGLTAIDGHQTAKTMMEKLMMGDEAKKEERVATWQCPVCHICISVKNRHKHSVRHRYCNFHKTFHFNKDLGKCQFYTSVINRLFPTFKSQ